MSTYVTCVEFCCAGFRHRLGQECRRSKLRIGMQGASQNGVCARFNWSSQVQVVNVCVHEASQVLFGPVWFIYRVAFMVRPEVDARKMFGRQHLRFVLANFFRLFSVISVIFRLNIFPSCSTFKFVSSHDWHIWMHLAL